LAILNFEKTLEIDPEATAVYFPLGLAYAVSGNDEKAEQFLLKAEALGASTGESLTTRGLIASRQGRKDEAILLFDRAISIAPGQGEAYVEKARLLNEMGRSDDAYRTLQLASAAAGNTSAVWFSLGVYAYNRGDHQQAMNAYLKVLELEPGNAQAHANLASTYRQMERFADANAQYRAAYENGIDKEADLFSEWGFCLGQTKEWERSIVRLTSARELSPTAIDHNNVGWAYYNAARADKESGNQEEHRRKLELSREALQRAVAMDDTLYAAFLNLGATNNGLGDFEAAKAALERALSLQNDWLIAVNQLGLAYRGSNDLQGAIDQFVRANRLNTNDVFSLYNLGELYHLTGNRREARRIGDRLKTMDATLARRLDDVLSGKIVLDEANRNIRQRVPTIRRLPY
jgi:tetratricopeptide (TPR) repeat protein